MASEKVVVVVDPYSSGRILVSELTSQRWPMVCIQSSQNLADFWLAQLNPNHFIETIRHEELQATLACLEKYDVVTVIPGSEPGVLLAEDLQEALHLPCNGAATKQWRRDKYHMQERLREAGLRAINQFHANDVEEALAWQQKWGRWPVVVKPPMSGGTDGVYWCHSQDDIREAFKAECGKLNCNGMVNEKLLVQEYLDGPEYIVDCVSFVGKHIVSGMWAYKKCKNPDSKSFAVEYARFIHSMGPEQDTLIAYVLKCLDALSFRFGASHSEVIMCSDGPCLVETAARMHGLQGPRMTELATGIGTHELVIDVAVNNGRLFQQLFERNYRYVVKRWVFETLLQNKDKEGILAAPIDVEKLRRLPSVMDVFVSAQPGQELKITRDLATSPGIVLQVHTSLEQCMEDICTLRELESTVLFEVAS